MDDTLSAEDKEFLAQCEEEFKDRFTERDEVFMKAFNKELSKPPILENSRGSYNGGRRNDRRHQRSYRPYDRNRDYHSRDNNRSYNDRNNSYGSRYSRSNY